MKLPWYSFLYRLLGAQGTFWLWLLVVAALWWTTKPALIRLFNRKPQRVTHSQALNPSRTVRWVRVEGLQLELDRRLLLSKEPPNLPPLQLLLNGRSPTARWWIETRAQADLHVGLAPTAALGGTLGALGAGSQRTLIKRLARLEGDPTPFLPPPQQALLIQRGGSTLGLAPDPPPPPSDESDAERYRRRLDERIALLRGRVSAATVEGVLDPIPQAITRRLKDELGVEPAPYLVQEGVKPSELETRLFGGAAALLVFLAAGLYGATRSPVPPAERGEGEESESAGAEAAAAS